MQIRREKSLLFYSKLKASYRQIASKLKSNYIEKETGVNPVSLFAL